MSDKEKNDPNSENPSNKEGNEGTDSSSSLIEDSVPEQKFGEWLKAQRNAKNVSLEEIAAVTKIHIVQLQNIEEDKLDNLPSLAFVRGFLVNYSRHIGLDEDEVLEQFRRQRDIDPSLHTVMKRRGAVPTTQPKVRVVQAPQLKRSPGSRGPDKPKELPFKKKHIVSALVVLFLIITLSLLVSLGQRSDTENVDIGPKPAPESEQLLDETTLEEIDTLAEEANQEKAKQAEAAAKVEKAPEPKAVEPKAVEPKPTPVVAAKKEEKKPEPSVAPTATLEIRGLDASWVKIRVDSKDPEGFQLDKGKSNRYSVKDKIVLSLSNAGAVEIKWNNKWYQSPGFRGDVKSVTLPDQLSSLKEK
ncbi:DUF4115 domain-containing protein [bacterium]|nr:DUF4115 domain-containing protein [bacterium]